MLIVPAHPYLIISVKKLQNVYSLDFMFAHSIAFQNKKLQY